MTVECGGCGVIQHHGGKNADFASVLPGGNRAGIERGFIGRDSQIAFIGFASGGNRRSGCRRIRHDIVGGNGPCGTIVRHGINQKRRTAKRFKITIGSFPLRIGHAVSNKQEHIFDRFQFLCSHLEQQQNRRCCPCKFSGKNFVHIAPFYVC